MKTYMMAKLGHRGCNESQRVMDQDERMTAGSDWVTVEELSTKPHTGLRYQFAVQSERARIRSEFQSKRYDLPFSVLCFGIVGGRSHDQFPSGPTARQNLIEAILNKLAIIMRDADVLGQLEKGRIVCAAPHDRRKAGATRPSTLPQALKFRARSRGRNLLVPQDNGHSLWLRPKYEA